jgi:hypothetical protein
VSSSTTVANAQTLGSRLPGTPAGRASASRPSRGRISILADPIGARSCSVQDVARGRGLAARLLWV